MPSLTLLDQLPSDKIQSTKIPYVLVDNQPWLKGKDIATILGYADTQQAMRVNVDADFKCKMEGLRPVSDTPLNYNTRNSIFINEAGLWSLVLRSEKPEAKQFRKKIYYQPCEGLAPILDPDTYITEFIYTM